MRPTSAAGKVGGPAEARDSTGLRFDGEALRAEMAAEGYVLLRGVVPPRDVGAVRDALAGVLSAAGLATSGPAGGGAGEPGPVTPAPAAGEVDVAADRSLYRRLYTVEALHGLPHHPALLALAGHLLEESPGRVLVHPRVALRVVFPRTPEAIGTTPAHQDHLGMQGTTDTYTFWVALVPCLRAMGVLAVAARSHLGGLLPYLTVPGSRVAGCDDAPLRDSWVCADLEPGDVLGFHSLTVHRALPNRSRRVRLSVDARYQKASDPVCDATLRELPDLPWDEVYAGWEPASGTPRRHWEGFTLDVVPFDAARLTPPIGRGPAL